MSSEAKVSYDLKRFAGIKRDYTPEEVERLRAVSYTHLTLPTKDSV